MAQVLLFGKLRDIAGWRVRVIDPTPASLSALIAILTREDPALGTALTGVGVRAAVNKVLALSDMPLTADVEVAFMPPMSGG